MSKLNSKLCLCLTSALMPLCLASCAKPPVPCYGGQIIYITQSDLMCMSRGTKQEILTNNLTVEKNK